MDSCTCRTTASPTVSDRWISTARPTVTPPRVAVNVTHADAAGAMPVTRSTPAVLIVALAPSSTDADQATNGETDSCV